MDASVLSGDVVVVNLHSGRQMIKQYIQGENDEIILRSFNPQHPDIKIKYTEVITMFRILASASLNRF
jgi:phage repressor protein C with HTH and peptisase S24 domain